MCSDLSGEDRNSGRGYEGQRRRQIRGELLKEKRDCRSFQHVNHPIDQHYVDVSLVSLSFLQYTKAM
jgi:hypothetical protein